MVQHITIGTVCETPDGTDPEMLRQLIDDWLRQYAPPELNRFILFVKILGSVKAENPKEI